MLYRIKYTDNVNHCTVYSVQKASNADAAARLIVEIYGRLITIVSVRPV